jgi:hypothetical protein
MAKRITKPRKKRLQVTTSLEVLCWFCAATLATSDVHRSETKCPISSVIGSFRLQSVPSAFDFALITQRSDSAYRRWLSSLVH